MKDHNNIIINGTSYTGFTCGKDLTVVCALHQQQEIYDIIGQDVPYFHRDLMGIMRIVEVEKATVKGNDIALSLKLY